MDDTVKKLTNEELAKVVGGENEPEKEPCPRNLTAPSGKECLYPPVCSHFHHSRGYEIETADGDILEPFSCQLGHGTCYASYGNDMSEARRH